MQSSTWNFISGVVDCCQNFMDPKVSMMRDFDALHEETSYAMIHVLNFHEKYDKFALTPPIDGRNKFTRDEINELKQVLIDKVCIDNSPLMNTIRMQIYFERADKKRGIKHLDTLKRDSKCLKLMHELIQYNQDECRDSVRRGIMADKLTQVAIVFADLGSIFQPGVEVETRLALNSILKSTSPFPNCTGTKRSSKEVSIPIDALFHGTGQFSSKADRRSRIKEICLIVMGIRIYNWDCGMGEGAMSSRSNGVFPNIPMKCDETIVEIMENVQSLRVFIQSKIHSLTARLLNSSSSSNVEKKTANDSLVVASNDKLDIMEVIGMEKERKIKTIDTQFSQRCALIGMWQFTVYLVIMNKSATCLKSTNYQLQQDLMNNLSEIRGVLWCNTIPVPSDQILPQFMRLAKTWQCFRQTFEESVKLKHLMRNLQTFLIKIVGDYYVKSVLEEGGRSTVLENDMKNVQNEIEEDEFLELNTNKLCCEVVDMMESPASSDAIMGFCPVQLSLNQVLVRPSSSQSTAGDYRRLKFKNEVYTVCRSNRKKGYYATLFAENPDKYVSAIHNSVVRKMPTLSKLLGVQLDFSKINMDPCHPHEMPTKVKSQLKLSNFTIPTKAPSPTTADRSTNTIVSVEKGTSMCADDHVVSSVSHRLIEANMKKRESDSEEIIDTKVDKVFIRRDEGEVMVQVSFHKKKYSDAVQKDSDGATSSSSMISREITLKQLLIQGS